MPGLPPPEPYQLPNIPSNAYTLLNNLATAIDTANTKLTGHANKVSDINTSTNNAVGNVVTTSKGQATDALDVLWTDSKTDLSHAHDQLSAIITPSQGIGSGPNDFQSTLDQYRAVIQTGLTALDNLRQHQSSNGVVYLSPFNSQLMQWKQDVDQLDSALANINIVLDGIAMAIRGLNNGFRATCATGLVPGAPPTLFNKNAFAHQVSGDDGGKGDGGAGGGSGNGSGDGGVVPTAPSDAVQAADYAASHNGDAQPGYAGNGPFANDGRQGGQVLPRTTPDGTPITYREYDVHPYTRGVNRGQERIVIGSDGSKYYTSNHYQTFISF